jgi:hypothetical protein
VDPDLRKLSAIEIYLFEKSKTLNFN